MKNKSVMALAAALAAGAAGLAFAGEMEDLSTGAEKAFIQPGSAAKPAMPPEARPAQIAAAGAAEYKKLSEAFANGTVPSKEALAGWNAGRFLDRDYPDHPGSLLLASGEMQAEPAGAKDYKIVPFAHYGSPAFYETMNPGMNAGMAHLIKDQMKMWTDPVFTQAEVAFDKIMPSYNKGFSKYSIRKTADGRILVRNVWKDNMSNSVSEGVFYAYLTRNVTPPPAPAPAKSGQYVRVFGRVNLTAGGFMPQGGGFAWFDFNDWATFQDLSGKITSTPAYINFPFSLYLHPGQYVFQNVWVNGIYPQFCMDGKPLGTTHMSGFITVSGWPNGDYVSLNGNGELNGTIYVENTQQTLYAPAKK